MSRAEAIVGALAVSLEVMADLVSNLDPRLATGGPGHVLLMAGFLREEDTTVLWDVQV